MTAIIHRLASLMPPRNSSLRLVAITIVAVLALVYFKSPSMQIANPASEYCIQQGGTLQIVKDKHGNEIGMCKLPDGTVREEWEFFRSQNQQDETSSTQDSDQVTPAGNTQASKRE